MKWSYPGKGVAPSPTPSGPLRLRYQSILLLQSRKNCLFFPLYTYSVPFILLEKDKIMRIGLIGVSYDLIQLKDFYLIIGLPSRLRL